MTAAAAEHQWASSKRKSKEGEENREKKKKKKRKRMNKQKIENVLEPVSCSAAKSS